MCRRRRPRAVLAGIVAGLLAFASAAWALEEYSEDAVKAAFLLRFAEYVEWPPGALPAHSFTIAVLGADEVARNLQHLRPGYPVKNLPAQVRRIRSVAEMDDAQLLYIGPGQSEAVRAAAARVASRPVLLVTDEERSLDAGGVVNFVDVDQRVRFEVSLPAAARSGLQVSSKLLSVAIRVQTGNRSSVPTCEGAGCDQRVIVRDAVGPSADAVP
jgi:hypothetical protein